MLWISDASPLFFYSPAEVYFDSGASWTGVAGSNGTSHTTGGPAGVILPLVYATEFVPEFDAGGDYAATLAVGRSEAQAWQSGQNVDFTDFNQQTFLLSVTCATGQCTNRTDDFVFKGAWLGTNLAPTGSKEQSVLLDDASSAVTYSGFSAVSGSGPLEGVSVQSTDDGGTLSYTATSGSTASVKFNGASIIVRGVAGPSTGPFTVTIDGTIVATLNSTNQVESHNVILYFATNLDTASPHSLTLTAQGGLVIDSFTAYGPQGGVGFIDSSGTTITSPSGTTTAGSAASASSSVLNGTSGAQGSGSPNAGVIVGAVLGSLAGVFLLLWLFRRHVLAKKPPTTEEDPWDKANNLQNQKAEGVHVTTVFEHRYRYPGGVAHGKLKK